MRKPKPNAGFVAWSEARKSEETFIGAPTLGELIQGVHALPPSAQRRKLESWVSQIEIVDTQLAAIAFVHDLTIVTRNVRDFDIPETHGLSVVNPWT